MMIPITTHDEFNEAIARGDYRIVADEYLTVWVDGDPSDAYELHRSEDEWEWSRT